jgi:hypothetical protein
MAEDFKGLGNEALRNVQGVRDTMREIDLSVRDLNRQLSQTDKLTQEVRSEFTNINNSAKKFADLQDQASRSAKGTTDAIKEQQKQLSIVRSLNVRIDELYKSASGKTGEAAFNLKRQAENLANARDNAKTLANEYGKLAEDSSKLDKSTMWFSAFSEFSQGIPGLKAFSQPFQEAAEASRKQVLENAKAVNLKEKISQLTADELRTGRGLTADKIKQLGLEDIVGKKRGSAAAQALRAAKSTAKTQSVGLTGLSAGFKALGPIITKAMGPLAIIKVVADVAKFFVDAMFDASKLVAELQRDMALTAEEAEAVRQRTYEISENSSKLADTQGKIVILQKQIVQSQKEINDSLDTQIDLTQELGTFGEELLVQSSILRDNFGLSTEAVAELDKEAIRTGKSVEDITKETFGTIAAVGLEKGILLDVNKILTEATKIQGNLRLSFKGSTTELSKAVAQAKLLGLTLQQSEKTAESLLNFEQSIEAELTAELLTGRQLNLDKARLAALNGDFLGVAKEINAQGITYNKLQDMNLVQRKAIADALGLSTDELADSLKKQQEYNALQARALAAGVKISDLEKKSLKELFEENKALGRSEEQVIAALGEEIYLRKQAEDAQTKFNKALDKAKESFAKLAESGTIDKFAAILTQFVNKIASGKSIIGALFGSSEVYTKESAQEELDSIAGGVGKSSGRYKAAQREIEEQGFKVEDGKVINADDFTIRTHPKDELVIAGGTNLSGGTNQEMVGLLKQLISATEQSRQVTVSVDGEAVFSAMGRVPMK